jgi:hypothetical protein
LFGDPVNDPISIQTYSPVVFEVAELFSAGRVGVESKISDDIPCQASKFGGKISKVSQSGGK